MSPFRLTPDRAKVQFTTSAAMPHLIFQAALASGAVSNTVYCQHALAHAIARDLGMDVNDILADLPEPRGPATHLIDRASPSARLAGAPIMTGPANTDEEVR